MRDEALDLGSVEILRVDEAGDTTDITAGFQHSAPSGGGAAATSADTLMLPVGVTYRILGRVRDEAGNLSDPAEAVLIHGTAEAVAVEPGDGMPGANVERGLCLRIALDAASEAECGELRIAHALPPIRTLSRTRAPVLTYHAGQAEPHPLVAANVALPTTAAIPDSLVAVLEVGGSVRGRGTWHKLDLLPGRAARIVVDATTEGGWAADSTGLYDYTLEVTTYVQGTALSPDTLHGEFVHINRAASPFGAGWWLAGLERLHFLAGGDILWIGGGGSARVYAPVAADRWAAPSLGRPDTLVYDGASQQYLRKLPGGAAVVFGADGLHRATRNRLGQETRFDYAAVAGGQALRRIVLPMPDPADTSRVYAFMYDGTGRLERVEARAGTEVRAVTLAHDSASRRVAGITDPDTSEVRFGYAGTSAPNLIVLRRDRAFVFTSLHPDGAGRLGASIVDIAALNLTTTFDMVETLGLAPEAVDTARAGTRINGPRTDVADTTRIWIDRLGAVRKSRSALGDSTLLRRTDARFPALVTEIIHPNGYTERASYDARGNLAAAVALEPYGPGSGADTTRYVYDDHWPDFVSRIVAPEGDSTVIEYDAATGDRLWQQDARGSASRVEFGYDAHGLLTAVRTPDGAGSVAVDSLVYDGAGNLHRVRTPMEAWTTHHKDAFGRDTLVLRPVDGTHTLSERVAYDLQGRVKETVTVGPALDAACTDCTGDPLVAQTLTVTNTYDREGRLEQVFTSLDPDPLGGDQIVSYDYDNAGRKTRERTFGANEHFDYTPAGQLERWITARGDTIRMAYDAAGRLIQRVLPAVHYGEDECLSGEIDGVPCVPTLDFDTLTVPADTQRFAYDAAGRLVEAENRAALVRRSYYPNGLLAGDTLTIRPYAPGDGDGGAPGGPGDGDIDPEFAPEVAPESLPLGGFGTLSGGGGSGLAYGTAYTYDRNGRLGTLTYPGALQPGSATSVSYGYHPWGALASVTGLEGETYAYDLDGRRVRRLLGTAADPTSIYNDTLAYDARGKVVHAEMRKISREAFTWYTGLGQVAAHRWQSTNGTDFHVDEFRTDALGRMLWSRQRDALGDEPSYDHRYDSAGRLSEVLALDSTALHERDNWRSYDASGNVAYAGEIRYGIEMDQTQGEVERRTTRHHYRADQKLAVVVRYARPDEVQTGGPDDLVQEHRYDALGRRVLVRTQHEPFGASASQPAITRYVWAGEQLLGELRAPGGEEDDLEAASATGRHYGRVAYVHGGGIDAPLGLYRRDFDTFSGPTLIVPHANWRGQYERGSFVGGAPECTGSNTDCIHVEWPAPELRTYLDGPPAGAGDWVGSLVHGQRDASGLLYRRNRYYDPVTGQFTQRDRVRPPPTARRPLPPPPVPAAAPPPRPPPAARAACRGGRRSASCRAPARA